MLDQKKWAISAVFLLPFVIAFLLQSLIYKVSIVQIAYLSLPYMAVSLLGIVLVYGPSYAVLFKSSVFAQERNKYLKIYSVSLIVLVPFISYLNKIAACPVFGHCV